MSERNEHPEPETAAPAESRALPERGRKRRFLAGLVTGGLVGGLLGGAASAWSHSEGPGGWHGRAWCRGHGADPATQRERLESTADWLLKRVGASDAQRDRIKSLLAATLSDLAPLREAHLRNRDAFVAAITRASVDRASLDELRRAELDLAAQASERIVTALADIAEVLTPAQRGELVELAERFRH
jgi:Spy/CpxP family protein refolding chaperone